MNDDDDDGIWYDDDDEMTTMVEARCTRNEAMGYDFLEGHIP